ncbi:protoporphyrinogen oxidase HemJ [Notoacmeibacter sp. MSK16QG-6]|uniref:protoporphyrinogen oxidase HemJ n=1 Tax=Notoacmeibacter sp. MSK16QG-6 TaxID=2957982 RepID=UPI0020A1D8A5|nr:protoporphyrinogen oxidase HemJ [Notoacmeibacter sp. MSK16QG-6]MCP1199107.1 protoporphyrinogen oxidase HemJ [Notoacmeibacter sp. MSK16QG-6]
MKPADRSLRKSPLFRAIVAILVTGGLLAGLLVFAGDGFYLWAKALHVMAVISWMAAMFYLPRLFVYHTQVDAGSPQSELFKIMERRLLRAIMNPAMIVAWVLGLYLAIKSGAFSEGWFHVKFLAVFLLSGLHGYLSAATRRFAEDRNAKTERHWRIVNEAPTLLMIVIVIMVVVKPF